nr:hypothetical protein [Bacteroidota bacterium]
MKKVYILFLIAFLLPGYMMAQVTFTQTTTDDFEKGFHDNVLVGSGDVYLPEKGSDPGTWVSTTVLPAPLTGHEIVTYKGWAYLVGGFNGSSNTSAVYRAPIQAAGVGTWTGLTSLPVALRDHAVVVGVSYIYVLGGIVNGNPSDQIYYAQLNTDGSIGSWQTSSVALPQALWGHSAKYINGYILVVGGADEISTTDASDAVYYASVDPLGALSEFSATASLPQTRNGHTMVSYGGMLYVLGGYDNTGTKHSTVYYSGIDLDGTCSGWLSADVPVAVSNHASVCYNGLMTVICGDVGGAVPLTRKVYWADIDESPNFNWILSASELYYRRKDGQAFVSNGQIIFSGGEELAGTPINVSRYSLLTMDTEKVNEGGFVSFPFPLGSEKNVDNIDYDITYNAGDNNYEIFYRLAGNDAVWGSWVSGGQNNPVLIGQSKAYVQYRFDFSATNDQEITFNELDLNIVGYTELSGDLNSIATLTQANSPYWATANIWFTAGTHTIEPGVTIVFSPNTGLEIGQASLTCEGTEANPILLNYYNDEEIGMWNGVYFNENSDNGVTSSLAYTSIENAGLGSRNANLYCYNTNQPHITYCGFRYAVGNGIRLEGSNVTFDVAAMVENTENGLYLNNSNPNLSHVELGLNGNAGLYYAGAGLTPTFNTCTINENTYGIYSPTPNNSFAPPAASSYTLVDNETDIAIGGGTITADRTWAYFEQGYAILGSVTIKGNGYNPRLTLDPAATLKFATATNMQIGGSASEGGELYAEGSLGWEITFTSLNGEIGGWNGLYFTDGSDSYSSSSSLKYCVVEKASDYNLYSYNTHEPFILYSEFKEAGNRGIVLSNSDISIEETGLFNNANYGLYLVASSPSLVLVDMNGNGTAGVYYGDATCDPTYFSCNIMNSDFGIRYYTCNTSFSESTINGTVEFINVVAGIAMPGGVIDASRTWAYNELNYAILGDIDIYSGNNPRLTIEPGNTIKIAVGVRLDVAHTSTSNNNSYRGGLYAEGTAESPITFTSLSDTIGGWEGLVFFQNSDYNGASSSLQNCIFEKANSYNVHAQYTNQPVIDSCIFRDAAGIGLYCYDADLSVSNSSLVNNYTGIQSNISQPVFTNCEISDNEMYELYAVNPDGFPAFVNSTINTSAKSGSIILVGGGQQTISRSWPYFDGDYVVSATIEIWNFGSPSLTITPGNTIKFSKDVKIDIARYTGSHDSYRGSLIANGTADNPILFTALNDSIGGWDGLQFNDCSDLSGTTSSLKNCTIEKAEGRNILSQNTNQPTIDSCLMQNSGGIGLYCYYSSLSVGNSTIINNQTGIRSDNGQSTFTNCEINSNEQQELFAVNPDGFPTFISSTISTSGKNESVILVGGGQQTISRSWPYFDGDYVVSATIEIWNFGSPSLTI